MIWGKYEEILRKKLSRKDWLTYRSGRALELAREYRHITVLYLTLGVLMLADLRRNRWPWFVVDAIFVGVFLAFAVWYSVLWLYSYRYHKEFRTLSNSLESSPPKATTSDNDSKLWN